MSAIERKIVYFAQLLDRTGSMGKATGIFFLWVFSTLHCHAMAQEGDMQQIIEAVQEKYAPDSRVELFRIVATQQQDTLLLEGETTSEPAYLELILQSKKVSAKVSDNIRLLPDKKLGDETGGVIYNSVGTLRSEPRYGSELVSQALLGMPVKILEKKDGWLRIQTPDRYIGWINGSVKTMTRKSLQEYLRKPKIIITSVCGQSFESQDAASFPVSDLVAGDMLTVRSEKERFYEVVYPDGRAAYVKKTDAVEVSDWLRDVTMSGESVVNTALRFKGIPYLWGGTSSKGLDCSGFTKLVYFLHGLILARDASQQVLYGKLIDEAGNFGEALPGDLLFFGSKASSEDSKEKVVHVGIYIGDKRFIHASDYVRINSFDPSDPLYDEFNANRYLRTQRIIGEVNSEGIEEIFLNSFYQ